MFPFIINNSSKVAPRPPKGREGKKNSQTGKGEEEYCLKDAWIPYNSEQPWTVWTGELGLGLGATVLEGCVPVGNSSVEIVQQEWPEILIWERLNEFGHLASEEVIT